MYCGWNDLGCWLGQPVRSWDQSVSAALKETPTTVCLHHTLLYHKWVVKCTCTYMYVYIKFTPSYIHEWLKQQVHFINYIVSFSNMCLDICSSYMLCICICICSLCMLCICHCTDTIVPDIHSSCSSTLLFMWPHSVFAQKHFSTEWDLERNMFLSDDV